MKTGWKKRSKNELAQAYVTAHPGSRFVVTELAQKVGHPDTQKLRRFLNREALSLLNGHARGPRLGREFETTPSTGKGEYLVAITFIASASDGKLADENYARDLRRGGYWKARARRKKFQLPKVINRQLNAPPQPLNP